MLQVFRALYYAVTLSEEAPLDKDVVKVQRMKLGFLGLMSPHLLIAVPVLSGKVVALARHIFAWLLSLTCCSHDKHQPPVAVKSLKGACTTARLISVQ